MSRSALIEYGFLQLGEFKIEDRRFKLPIDDRPIWQTERCIYAFLIGDEIVRIGCTANKLIVRMRSWQNGVSRAIMGDFRATPEAEFRGWEARLASHGHGYLFAREGTIVASPIGMINISQAEESVLIARHKPALCNDLRRHRHQTLASS